MPICVNQRKKHSALRKWISGFMVFCFMLSLPGPAGAQMANLLPSGAPVALSSIYQAPTIKGLNIHPENPFLLDFIVNTGTDNVQGQAFKDSSEQIVKYFLTAMTIPDKEAWVNLSPYEKDRIIPDALGQTIMGKVMLEQDYVLKQLSASLTNPETELGQKFWNQVKARAQKELNTTEIPLSTFNKVWIVPGKAEVAELDGKVFVTGSSLKVMLEEDYDAMTKTQAQADIKEGQAADRVNQLSSVVFRELILPKLEEEVNRGKNFAAVRQIYDSAILAVWYKTALKESLLGKIYVDKSKVAGVETEDKTYKQNVYEQYLAAFKKGAYNIIKEEDKGGESIPRKYFSGGLRTIPGTDEVTIKRGGVAAAAVVDAGQKDKLVSIQLAEGPDATAIANEVRGRTQEGSASSAISSGQVQRAQQALRQIITGEEIRIQLSDIRSFTLRDGDVKTMQAISAVLKQKLSSSDEQAALDQVIPSRYNEREFAAIVDTARLVVEFEEAEKQKDAGKRQQQLLDILRNLVSNYSSVYSYLAQDSSSRLPYLQYWYSDLGKAALNLLSATGHLQSFLNGEERFNWVMKGTLPNLEDKDSNFKTEVFLKALEVLASQDIVKPQILSGSLSLNPDQLDNLRSQYSQLEGEGKPMAGQNSSATKALLVRVHSALSAMDLVGKVTVLNTGANMVGLSIPSAQGLVIGFLSLSELPQAAPQGQQNLDLTVTVRILGSPEAQEAQNKIKLAFEQAVNPVLQTLLNDQGVRVTLGSDRPYDVVSQKDWEEILSNFMDLSIDATWAMQHVLDLAKLIMRQRALPENQREILPAFLNLRNFRSEVAQVSVNLADEKGIRGQENIPAAEAQAKRLARVNFIRTVLGGLEGRDTETGKTLVLPDSAQDGRIEQAGQPGKASSAADVGGINFDPALMNLQIKRNPNGVPLPLPQQDLPHVNIQGLYPVIINIQNATMANFPVLSQAEARGRQG